jgi:threonine/homoserine/homoserine lactone efflux protein
MSFSTYLSVALFALSMSGTPGPNNVMLLASGVNFGFRRTVPHIIGIRLGFVLLYACSALGLCALLLTQPQLHLVLKLVGAAFLVWMAWKLANSRNVRAAGEGAAPMTFLQAAFFQCVNPKAWVSALSMVLAFVHPETFVPDAIITCAIFSIVAMFSTSSWVLFGSLLKTWLSDPVRLKWFNITMAVLLVASLWPMLK